MAKSTENEYPAEATIGDQWRRRKIANSRSFSAAELHRVSFPMRLSHEVERLFDEMIHRPWGFCREIRAWNPSVERTYRVKKHLESYVGVESR